MKVTITDPSFMPKYYEMDPETDDLLPTGRHLETDMVVLIEDPSYRAELRDIQVLLPSGQEQMDRIRKFNRWATVESVKFADDNIRVLARYADGTKRILVANRLDGWYVKKDSLPAKETYPEPGKVFNDDVVEKVTFEQIGTGRRVTIPKEELRNTVWDKRPPELDDVIGTVTEIREDEDGLKVEGVLNEEGMAYVEADAEASMHILEGDEDYGVTGSGIDEDDESETEEGPMVRAMRMHQSEPQLREKRTVNKTEVIEIYSPGRSVFGNPYSDRRRW